VPVSAFSLGSDSALKFKVHFHQCRLIMTVCADALVVREATSVGFLSYLAFTPTDEIYFVDNYYSNDVIDVDRSTSAATTSLGDVDSH
jgi:hypothetical protein